MFLVLILRHENRKEQAIRHGPGLGKRRHEWSVGMSSPGDYRQDDGDRDGAREDLTCFGKSPSAGAIQRHQCIHRIGPPSRQLILGDEQ